MQFQHEPQPWFRGTKDLSPFSLFHLLIVGLATLGHPFSTGTKQLDSMTSLETFWGGLARENPEIVGGWRNIIEAWMGSVVVCGTGAFYIFPKLATKKPTVVTLAQPTLEIHNVAWALSSNDPLKPLLVLTVNSVILIYDVTTRTLVGNFRGHGGPITSVAVHPNHPNLFCTTSRDFTTRIHNISLLPVQAPNNPHWLPSRRPSLAGPAHGLHMTEPEGNGIGQCVAVLVGERSGGHRGAVLCCAFHPSQPLIATGGMDRAVKIWRIPPSVFESPEQPRLAREDKPLFSTDLIHKARVLSIHWVADDILTSSSADAMMRLTPEGREDTYWEEGTVVVWQWLGYHRFFPPGKLPQQVMRGTASDWRNSESFKILSGYHLPMNTHGLHVYRSLTHDPVLFIPNGKVIQIFNISEFRHRTPPKFPLDSTVPVPDPSDTSTQRDGDSDQDDAVGTRKDKGKGRANKNQDGDGDGDEERATGQTFVYPPPAPLAPLSDSVRGWEVVAELPGGSRPTDMPDIIACSIGCEGLAMIGIGSEGALYVWRLRE